MPDKTSLYTEIITRINALLLQETHPISAMATIVCELHHGISCFHWTGFYLVDGPELLTVGPYQGSHGCLKIPFSRGVCGLCARTGLTQIVADVHEFRDHIACSPTTKSEIVVPVFNKAKKLAAVLDVDSDEKNAFDETDQKYLEQICKMLERIV